MLNVLFNWPYLYKLIRNRQNFWTNPWHWMRVCIVLTMIFSDTNLIPVREIEMPIMRLRNCNAIAYLHSPSRCDVIHCHTNTGLVLVNDAKTATNTRQQTIYHLLYQFRIFNLSKQDWNLTNYFTIFLVESACCFYSMHLLFLL